MARFGGFMPRGALCLLLALLAVSILPPRFAAAHSEDATHEHRDTVPGNGGSAVGIDERLGAKIPLDLTFRDEAGQQVRLGDLVTGPTIILPVYYSCTNICSYLQGGLASVLPAVKRKPGEEYRVISVSFDETETPAMAARSKRMYLSAMNAPFPADGWRFLTGDSQNNHRLTDAAGYRFQRKGRDFIHPVASFVIAGDGTIVRYLYGTTFLPKDLTLALIEAREGVVGSSIRKMVNYCFTFDPAGKTYVFNLLRVCATVVFVSAGGFLLFLVLAGRKRGPYSSRKL
jgi:protein SCO1/2